MKFSTRFNTIIFIVLSFISAIAHAQTVDTSTNTVINTHQNSLNYSANEPSFPKFDFDWQSHQTIAPSLTQIHKAENFVEIPQSPETLSTHDKTRYGKLLYQMGCFYSHVKNNPQVAINKLNEANRYLETPNDKAWIYNQLAYAYHLQYEQQQQQQDRDKAIDFTHQVITQYPHTVNAAVAFAYSIEGLLLKDEKKYPESAIRLQQAFDFYAKEGQINDTFQRAKTHLAQVLIKLHQHDPKLLAMLQSVKQYWVSQGDIGQTRYAANHFIALGQVYMSMKKYAPARNEFETAIAIYKNIDGPQNSRLAQPYHYLAQAYRLDDKEKLADLYEEAAMQLTKPSHRSAKAPVSDKAIL